MRVDKGTTYTIQDFLEWEGGKQLELTPKFQRRDVWIPKAKSYLVDTILRSMPIPALFVRLRIDPINRRAIREVVDGQQRLRAVFGYIRGEFPVLAVHNEQYGAMYFGDLPEDVQRSFLGYAFLVNVLHETSDAEVLSVFARMNTYTTVLTAQELRNAQYFGAFKQTVYEIARRHYAFWRNNRILSDSKISRMADAEMVSELLVTMLDGIRQTKSVDLNAFYTRYDDEFREGQSMARRFDDTIDAIGNMLGTRLVTSIYRKMPWFYSLFCAVYDARFGLPGSLRPRLALDKPELKRIGSRLMAIDDRLRRREPPSNLLDVVEATRRGTADPGKRKLRHDFLWAEALTQKAVEAGM